MTTILSCNIILLTFCTLVLSVPETSIPAKLLIRSTPFWHRADSKKEPSIYCYYGKQRSIKKIWETVSIHIDIDSDKYEKFEGSNPKEVMLHFEEHQSTWSVNIFPFFKNKLIKLDPFNTTCIGILTTKDYMIKLIENEIDYMQLSKFALGMILFFFAKKLSGNQLFYYICGILFGICCSVIIIIYLISRLFPNKPMMYGIAIGGWTVSVYFLQYLFDNAKLIFLQYREYVFYYIALSGLISFAVCYRFGPLSNPRSQKLIQWSLQAAGLLLIFYSSSLFEVTYTIDLILLFARIMPFTYIFKGFQFLRKKIFRPKMKLLTKKEYREQARKETKKALDDLRGYCSSPKCNTWKTVIKLKNPIKFAEFMEGSFHVPDSEVEEFSSLSIKPNGTIITDDSDSVAEFTEEED